MVFALGLRDTDENWKGIPGDGMLWTKKTEAENYEPCTRQWMDQFCL